MKFFVTSALCLCSVGSVFGQSTYATTGGELIFSWADITQGGAEGNSNLRFAPVINLQTNVNRDFSKKVGIFTGLALRNVGYRMDGYVNPSNGVAYEKSFRSYNLGLPIALKFGNMDKGFFYAGYEIEMGFLYKEKTYENDDKIDKITGWWSDRQNIWQSSVMAGIQFPYGLNVKFKYYLTEFHNQNYTDGGGVRPYAGLTSNIMYVSLSMMLFKNAEVYTYN
jgi:hypothetical protein